MGPFHKPVMVAEVADMLQPKPGGIYLDGTLGGGGHARQILERSSPDGLLVGIDLDEDALSESEKTLKPFGSRTILIRGNFAEMDRILRDLDIEKVNGILLDLGVSSHQLEDAGRGFSFSQEAPLDMRMDRRQAFNAHDLVNVFSRSELEKIIRDYGEEKMAGRIAKAITLKRKRSPIRTTTDLTRIIEGVVPAASRHRHVHPATRTFQAIRIAVNDELSNLREAIACGVKVLDRTGRFAIVSFHSLEDRIVKDSFRSLEKGCICPPDLPRCICGREGQLRILTRRPLVPRKEEVADNPRARSARLRTAERI
ncbi:MAG: 16S rRNA (cytosine(1402)-N(4))-methyltransferase RsmH [Deltaproteobacteria bacterium]|nr:16S rRNA (cytosine(1402)-N(4))-methyltransferase RsmH [Deltaproteobacteria bacterium]